MAASGNDIDMSLPSLFHARRHHDRSLYWLPYYLPYKPQTVNGPLEATTLA